MNLLEVIQHCESKTLEIQSLKSRLAESRNDDLSRELAEAKQELKTMSNAFEIIAEVHMPTIADFLGTLKAELMTLAEDLSGEFFNRDIARAKVDRLCDGADVLVATLAEVGKEQGDE